MLRSNTKRLLGEIARFKRNIQVAHLYSPSSLCSRSFFVPLLLGRLVPFKQADIMLKPLLFEVPGITAETAFVGRDWLFARLEEVLRKTSSCEGRGAVIVGNAGSGKTAVMWRLVTLSSHGTHAPQEGSGAPKCEHPMFTRGRFVQSSIPDVSFTQRLQVFVEWEEKKNKCFGGAGCK